MQFNALIPAAQSKNQEYSAGKSSTFFWGFWGLNSYSVFVVFFCWVLRSQLLFCFCRFFLANRKAASPRRERGKELSNRPFVDHSRKWATRCKLFGRSTQRIATAWNKQHREVSWGQRSPYHHRNSWKGRARGQKTTIPKNLQGETADMWNRLRFLNSEWYRPEYVSKETPKKGAQNQSSRQLPPTIAQYILYIRMAGSSTLLVILGYVCARIHFFSKKTIELRPNATEMKKTSSVQHSCWTSTRGKQSEALFVLNECSQTYYCI